MLWHQTSCVYAGNNQANVEPAYCLVEMEQFLKTSIRNEASLFIYIDIGACVKSVNL
jgi:hypothetical protein